MQSIIQIHPADNVAVALRDLENGEQRRSWRYSLCCLSRWRVGINLPCTRLRRVQNIIKYGLPIGHALTRSRQAGEHIHSQNGKTNLSDLDEYQYQPEFASAARADGRS